MSVVESNAPRLALARNVGLAGLVATGISTMVGGAINVLPLMIYRSVPSLGDHVALAYAIAAIPAAIAALVYARLSACMPRAGGSYVYLSRSLHPFVGFVVSFGQWVGLSVILGVVAYLLVPFLRDCVAIASPAAAAQLAGSPLATLGLPLASIWLFAIVSLTGNRAYAMTLVPLTVVMFGCALVVVVAGFGFDHADFLRAAPPIASTPEQGQTGTAFDLPAILAAAAVLFGSFVGFESIAQAGGEARRPQRDLPRAILFAIAGVACFYILFTVAVFHVVPWQYAAVAARETDLTVPGLFSYVLSPTWAAIIAAGVVLSLLNHVPAMLLAVSRMLFAWAEDGFVPKCFARVHPKRRTPDMAIIASAALASAGVLACHFAGDFFLGVDLLATCMLLNFVLVCFAMLRLAMDPAKARAIGFERRGRHEAMVPVVGAVLLGALLVFHVARDLQSAAPAWYLRSSWVQLLVMAVAAALFAVRSRAGGITMSSGG
ncbi:APC family permease [Steroidobacter sp.]|uniref:APC family permease n=1 Tax=Steroidobacter sp. TaxID=1978227 RepID=UPI001A480D2E|nr:APC family permease [Steroidobacter sp.]MBL8264960.1 APC family permease [Steroidobacter sp.]